MNRYSRVSTSQFNPLGLKEIMMVPLAKQSQHDQVMAKADELGLFDINALEADQDLVNEYTSGYRNKLDNLTDRVTKSGIDNMSKTELRSLMSERNKWLTEGDGRKVSENYSRYIANKEQLDKLYQSGKISQDKYQSGIAQALGNYKGVVENDVYNPFNAVHDVDFFKKAKEVASAMSNNPNKITQFSGLKYNPTTGKYVDVKTNIEKTQEQAIRMAVRARLKMDTDVMSDLNQRQSLGMLGNASVDQYIDGIGVLNEVIYAKDNRTSSKQYVGIDHKQFGTDDTNDSAFNYVLGADKVLQRENDKLISQLDGILSGKQMAVNTTTGELVRKDVDFTGQVVGKHGYIYKPVAASYDNLQGKEKEKFDNIYNNLVKTNKLSSQIEPNSPEAIKEVRNYLESIKNFRAQPVILTNGLVKNYSNISEKMNTSTPEQLAKAISLQPERVRWFTEDGKLYNSFKDIKKKYREELISGDGVRVSGVPTGRNTLRADFGNTVPSDLLTSPYEVQFSDGTKLLASRTDGERAQRSYKVDTQYSELYYKTIETPGFGIPTFLPGLGNVEVRRPIQQYIDPETNTAVDLEVITPDGNVRKYTEDQFEARYKSSYGIK